MNHEEYKTRKSLDFCKGSLANKQITPILPRLLTEGKESSIKEG